MAGVHGPQPWVRIELYDRYRKDPQSVDPETRALFAQWTPPADIDDEPQLDASPSALRIAVGAVNLAQAVRRYGHLAAQLDPLGSRPVGDPALLPATHGVTEEDLRRLPANLVSSPLCDGLSTMLEVVDTFRRLTARRPATTTRTSSSRRSGSGSARRLKVDASARLPIRSIPLALLDRLTEVEAFERFLHRTFPGKTRFSIEGLDMLVPILDEVIAEAAEAGIARS